MESNDGDDLIARLEGAGIVVAGPMPALEILQAIDDATAETAEFIGIPGKHHFQYILDDRGNPVPVPETTLGFEMAATFFRDHKRRRVAHTAWKWRGRHFFVSTVFLVHNHDFSGEPGHPPVLWETMSFTDHPGLNEMQLRYTSKANAVVGHQCVVGMVKTYLRTHRQPPSPLRARVARRRIEAGQDVLRRRHP